MKKFLLQVSLLFFLIFPSSFAIAEVTYSRTPILEQYQEDGVPEGTESRMFVNISTPEGAIVDLGCEVTDIYWGVYLANDGDASDIFGDATVGIEGTSEYEIPITMKTQEGYASPSRYVAVASFCYPSYNIKALEGTVGVSSPSIIQIGISESVNAECTNEFCVMIERAEEGYASTTGERMGATISFVGDNLIKLFLGSMLALLYELRYWIVALFILFIIVIWALNVSRKPIRNRAIEIVNNHKKKEEIK